MLSVRVIPVLLYKPGGLYKGTRFGDHRYVGDALNAVRIFAQKQANEVILLDIAATAEERTIPVELVSKISSESSMPLTVGGGIKDVQSAQNLLSAGAEKVTVNSHAVENPNIVSQIAALTGSQAVVASIDVRRGPRGGEVFTHCGTRPTGRTPAETARLLADAGAGEILLTSIDRDGTGEGFDIDLIAGVTSAVPIPVIACGGAGALAHFGEAVRLGGASAVAAGSQFVFHGRRRAVLICYPTAEDIEANLEPVGQPLT